MIESHITAQQYAADLIERCEGDLQEAVDVARCMLIQVPWQDRDGEAYWCSILANLPRCLEQAVCQFTPRNKMN